VEMSGRDVRPALADEMEGAGRGRRKARRWKGTNPASGEYRRQQGTGARAALEFRWQAGTVQMQVPAES